MQSRRSENELEDNVRDKPPSSPGGKSGVAACWSSSLVSCRWHLLDTSSVGSLLRTEDIDIAKLEISDAYEKVRAGHICAEHARLRALGEGHAQ